MQQGKFLVVDGLDGTGKSLAVGLTYEVLNKLGINTDRTREPGGTPYAEAICALIFNKGSTKDEIVHGMTENCLFWAARAQHVYTRILPQISAGTILFSDRFSDVTYAYQGGGRGIGLEKVRQFENLVLGDFRPDAIAIFVGERDILKARLNSRADSNRLDEEDDGFYTQAHNIFLARAAAEPNRYVLIDGDRSVLFTLGQMLGWMDRLGIISLEDHEANEQVLNTALNIYWDMWRACAEQLDRAMANILPSSDDYRERLQRLRERGEFPGFFWERVDAFGKPMLDILNLSNDLIAGVSRFHERNPQTIPGDQYTEELND